MSWTEATSPSGACTRSIGLALSSSPRHAADGCAPRLLARRGPASGRHRGPECDAQRLLLGQEIPRASSPHPLQRPRLGQDAGVPHQQHRSACGHRRRALQKPLAGRTLLQMDQTTLRIKRFLGTSENAVKTQIWCAVATYVLIAIVKKELQLDASLYTCLQILSVSIFEKTQINAPFRAITQLRSVSQPNQLILFNF